MNEVKLVKVRLVEPCWVANKELKGLVVDAVIYDYFNAIIFYEESYAWVGSGSYLKVDESESSVKANNSARSSASILSAIGDKPSKITIEF
jgi:hypothetical protein